MKGEFSRSENTLEKRKSKKGNERAQRHTVSYLMLLNWTIWKCCEKKMYTCTWESTRSAYMYTLGIRYSRFKSCLRWLNVCTISYCSFAFSCFLFFVRRSRIDFTLFSYTFMHCILRYNLKTMLVGDANFSVIVCIRIFVHR